MCTLVSDQKEREIRVSLQVDPTMSLLDLWKIDLTIDENTLQTISQHTFLLTFRSQKR